MWGILPLLPYTPPMIRCGVCIRGPGLTDAVGGTDPLDDDLPLLSPEPLESTDEVSRVGAATDEGSHDCLGSDSNQGGMDVKDKRHGHARGGLRGLC